MAEKVMRVLSTQVLWASSKPLERIYACDHTPSSWTGYYSNAVPFGVQQQAALRQKTILGLKVQVDIFKTDPLKSYIFW